MPEPMNEPPKPGERAVVLYRGDESKYGLTAVLARVTTASNATVVCFDLGGGRVLLRRRDEEGVEWARVELCGTAPAGFEDELWPWVALVQTLQAARRLAGTGDDT